MMENISSLRWMCRGLRNLTRAWSKQQVRPLSNVNIDSVGCFPRSSFCLYGPKYHMDRCNGLRNGMPGSSRAFATNTNKGEDSLESFANDNSDTALKDHVNESPILAPIKRTRKKRSKEPSLNLEIQADQTNEVETNQTNGAGSAAVEFGDHAGVQLVQERSTDSEMKMDHTKAVIRKKRVRKITKEFEPISADSQMSNLLDNTGAGKPPPPAEPALPRSLRKRASMTSAKALSSADNVLATGNQLEHSESAEADKRSKDLYWTSWSRRRSEMVRRMVLSNQTVNISMDALVAGRYHDCISSFYDFLGQTQSYEEDCLDLHYPARVAEYSIVWWNAFRSAANLGDIGWLWRLGSPEKHPILVFPELRSVDRMRLLLRDQGYPDLYDEVGTVFSNLMSQDSVQQNPILCARVLSALAMIDRRSASLCSALISSAFESARNELVGNRGYLSMDADISLSLTMEYVYMLRDDRPKRRKNKAAELDREEMPTDSPGEDSPSSLLPVLGVKHMDFVQLIKTCMSHQKVAYPVSSRVSRALALIKEASDCTGLGVEFTEDPEMLTTVLDLALEHSPNKLIVLCILKQLVQRNQTASFTIKQLGMISERIIFGERCERPTLPGIDRDELEILSNLLFDKFLSPRIPQSVIRSHSSTGSASSTWTRVSDSQDLETMRGLSQALSLGVAIEIKLDRVDQAMNLMDFATANSIPLTCHAYASLMSHLRHIGERSSEPVVIAIKRRACICMEYLISSGALRSFAIGSLERSRLLERQKQWLAVQSQPTWKSNPQKTSIDPDLSSKGDYGASSLLEEEEEVDQFSSQPKKDGRTAPKKQGITSKQWKIQAIVARLRKDEKMDQSGIFDMPWDDQGSHFVNSVVLTDFIEILGMYNRDVREIRTWYERLCSVDLDNGETLLQREHVLSFASILRANGDYQTADKLVKDLTSQGWTPSLYSK